MNEPSRGRIGASDIAAALKAEIEGGTYKPGDKLPSQSQLMRLFSVARGTAFQAIAVLREEGLATSRSGSGVYVNEPPEPHTLIDLIEATAQDRLELDALATSARVIAEAMRRPIAHALNSDQTVDWSIRLLRTQGLEPEDRYADRLQDDFAELASLNPASHVSFLVRVVPPSSQFGFAIVNNSHAYVGLSDDSRPVKVMVRGLLHADASTSRGLEQLTPLRNWFDHMWQQPD